MASRSRQTMACRYVNDPGVPTYRSKPRDSGPKNLLLQLLHCDTGPNLPPTQDLQAIVP